MGLIWVNTPPKDVLQHIVIFCKLVAPKLKSVSHGSYGYQSNFFFVVPYDLVKYNMLLTYFKKGLIRVMPHPRVSYDIFLYSVNMWLSQ